MPPHTTRHSLLGRLALAATPIALALLFDACADASVAPASRTDTKSPLLAAAAADPTSDVDLQTRLTNPINDTITASVPGFTMVNLGTGGAGSFKVNKATSAATALQAATNGTGPAIKGTNTGTGMGGSFIVNNASSSADGLLAQTNGTGHALRALATGNGSAGKFENSNPSNGSNALYVTTAGPGNALSVVNTGGGWAGLFTTTATGVGSKSTVLIQNAGIGSAIEAMTSGPGFVGSFTTTNTNSQATTVMVEQRGLSYGAGINITNSSNIRDALTASTNGFGWAARFVAVGSNAKGLFVETQGGAGLQVMGGTKNAVVPTSSGARELYTEESSEVWFTDYGFSALRDGRAEVRLDPRFVETVNTKEPYHVFVEAYGPAQLYVSQRTATGFVVARRDGDPDVEFSYRIVAKRLGFEAKRLDRAPWADAAAANTRR
jgi:hypothetical protein